MTIIVPAHIKDKAMYAVNVVLTRMRAQGSPVQSHQLRCFSLGHNTYRVTRGNVCLSY